MGMGFMRRRGWGWCLMRMGRGGSLILKAAPTSQRAPLCDQPIPVFSLRAALLPATLSQDTAYHSCDCPSPLTGDRLHLWFSCPTPTSDRDRKTCQIPFSCPWGNQSYNGAKRAPASSSPFPHFCSLLILSVQFLRPLGPHHPMGKSNSRSGKQPGREG